MLFLHILGRKDEQGVKQRQGVMLRGQTDMTVTASSTEVLICFSWATLSFRNEPGGEIVNETESDAAVDHDSRDDGNQ